MIAIFIIYLCIYVYSSGNLPSSSSHHINYLGVPFIQDIHSLVYFILLFILIPLAFHSLFVFFFFFLYI